MNAANARWGSLYDALYGTDAISEDGGADRNGGYNPVRGAKVIAYVRGVLNDAVPLASANWDDVTGRLHHPNLPMPAGQHHLKRRAHMQ